MLNHIDFADFEDKFKIGTGGVNMLNGSSDMNDGLMTMPSKRIKKPENISVLEHTRLRNIGKISAYFFNVCLLERKDNWKLIGNLINNFCLIICSNLPTQTGHDH